MRQYTVCLLLPAVIAVTRKRTCTAMTYCWSTRLSILVFWFAVVTGLSAMAAYRAYHLLQLLSPTFYWRQVLTHLLFFSLSLARGFRSKNVKDRETIWRC